MTKEGPRLEGVLSDCSDLVILVFQAVKIDVIRLIKPTSLIMEKLSLILPEAIATISVTLKKIRKLKSKLEEDGIDALKNESLFPTLNMNFLPKIEFDGVAEVWDVQPEPLLLQLALLPIMAIPLATAILKTPYTETKMKS